MPLWPDLTGDSGAKVESDRIVQESAPLTRIGIVVALRELLFPICERLRWYLKHKRVEIAKRTPITTPIEIPIISPDDSPFISSFLPPDCQSNSLIHYKPARRSLMSHTTQFTHIKEREFTVG